MFVIRFSNDISILWVISTSLKGLHLMLDRARRSSLEMSRLGLEACDGLEFHHLGSRQRMVGRSRMLPTDSTMPELEDLRVDR